MCVGRTLRGSAITGRGTTDSNRGTWFGGGQLQRHFGSDQSVWHDGDWNGFVRVAK